MAVSFLVFSLINIRCIYSVFLHSFFGYICLVLSAELTEILINFEDN